MKPNNCNRLLLALLLLGSGWALAQDIDNAPHGMAVEAKAPPPAAGAAFSPVGPAGRIGIGSAFLRSALIPGWGQKVVGARTAARNYFVADAALWLGVISFNVYGNWLKEDYRLLAAEHAHARVAGKSDKYFVDLGNYSSLEDYNQSRLQRRDVNSLYDPATHYWRWDSEAERARFKRTRLRSERAFNRGELVIAGILANHLISGIHAAWLANRHNSQLEKEGQQGMSSVPAVGVTSNGREIRLLARWEF
ncbi:MAG: hypothetical protein ONB48_02370 [candidate division KSB1 bacterium]|nr:hypothetical protein [candidate division KSB1 bacterium]MDZ7272478.1 hypothetical protein [candidate division KSB1 bacterium]MDZ7284498.1 hypothetical protein [candidate division KSB1 bacterium]MDZ7297106.1 hypothetical protein [candidate division KSB1 bacterium]MDZ7306554.1 hypothetical protein [candidate division KSB1 bacterium]